MLILDHSTRTTILSATPVSKTDGSQWMIRSLLFLWLLLSKHLDYPVSYVNSFGAGVVCSSRLERTRSLCRFFFSFRFWFLDNFEGGCVDAVSCNPVLRAAWSSHSLALDWDLGKLVKTWVRKIRQVSLQYKAAVKSTTACFLHSEGKHHSLEQDFGDHHARWASVSVPYRLRHVILRFPSRQANVIASSYPHQPLNLTPLLKETTCLRLSGEKIFPCQLRSSSHNQQAAISVTAEVSHSFTV